MKRSFPYLSQDLKLLPPLVEVDELLLGDGVRDGRVDHSQVGQKGAQVGNRAVADCLKKLPQSLFI